MKRRISRIGRLLLVCILLTALPAPVLAVRSPGGTILTDTVRTDSDPSVCPRDESCPLSAFPDADLNAWYHDGAHYCVERGILAGTDTGAFAPDLAVSRAMIAVILYRLEGLPAAEGAGFPDVAADAWYADAAGWAQASGIMAGYDDGRFDPDDPMTREQMALILYRYAEYQGEDMTFRADLSGYVDAGSISLWALPALQWANAMGLITGTSQEEPLLSPQGTATRAQLAVMLLERSR